VVHARSFGTLTDAVDRAVSGFGAAVTAKLKGPGHREDQLRGPVDEFLKAVAGAMNLRLVAHGEVPLPDRTAIPDYVVCIDKLPIGHVELKAPGKGVDPGRWSPGSHDRHQWERLSLLPNILYTDGDSWALYRAGQRIGRIARVRGSVESSGARLQPADGELLRVLADFLEWVPQPPGDLDRLVKNVAGLCSLLRDEVRVTLRNERAGDRETEFASLVHDWRRALFPRLNDDQFADAYAQTVTFALLLARVENIHFEDRTVEEIARLLGKSHSLMGKALDVLTPGWVLGRVATTIETLRRVIGTVHWDLLDDGTGSAYLTLYEQFLAVYDSELRKQTGSYFTPSAVVSFMVRFVDDVLRTRLGLRDGFAAPDLCVVDPAMGTGTFLVEIIDQVARTASVDGEVVRAKLRELAERLVGFEKQACPYAVAELRVAEAMRHHRTELPAEGMCLYVADALDAVDTDNLLDEFGEPLKRRLGSAYEPIERSKREADKIKSTRHVEVVIGNPRTSSVPRGLAAGSSAAAAARRASSLHPSTAFVPMAKESTNTSFPTCTSTSGAGVPGRPSTPTQRHRPEWWPSSAPQATSPARDSPAYASTSAAPPTRVGSSTSPRRDTGRQSPPGYFPVSRNRCALGSSPGTTNQVHARPPRSTTSRSTARRRASSIACKRSTSVIQAGRPAPPCGAPPSSHPRRLGGRPTRSGRSIPIVEFGYYAQSYLGPRPRSGLSASPLGAARSGTRRGEGPASQGDA